MSMDAGQAFLQKCSSHHWHSEAVCGACVGSGLRATGPSTTVTRFFCPG